MARTLTDEQRAALTRVHEVNLEHRQLRLSLEADLRRELEARLGELERREREAVAAAVEVGVPKRRIGAEGLHTRDPHAVRLVLEAP